MSDPRCRLAMFSVWFLVTTMATLSRAGVPVPLPPQSATHPADLPIDVAKLRIDNPAVLSTSGTWRFDLTHGVMTDGHFVHQSVTASSSEGGNPAGNAMDGQADTRWCADGDSLPQWWQVDLGTTEQIAGINLSFEIGGGHYQYRVEAGPDEAHLKMISDQSQSPGAGDRKLEWPATPARIVRVTITAATDADGNKKWASIREAEIIVARDGKKIVWSPQGKDQIDPHADDFAIANFDDSSWHDIPVPSNWEVLGYSRPTYFGPDSAVGLYRRSIDIPRSFDGKQVIWHFDGVTDSAEIWVNGQRVGYHEGGFTAFDIDLTSAIKPGEKNLLAVRVCKTTPTVDLDTGDYWLLGGIHRESYLVAVPKDHVQDITVVTRLDDHYVNATLLAEITAKAAIGHPWSASVHLFKSDGSAVDAHLAVTQKPSDNGVLNLHVEGSVPAPLLWSAEKPNLYYLLLTLQDADRTIETVEQRFGFRQVDIKDGQLLWNGVPIKCTGTCRHEEWSALGHALTEHEWQTDVAMMKAANINAVRTSHYNHAERFLELCDEKGIYVLDEIPACWVSNKDPKLTAAFVQHAAETLARDKNKPCVLAWSCGNESGWGPNFKAMVDYVAATDPTRPRFVSEQNKNKDPNLTISDHHYPGDNDLRKITTTDPGPSVITEGPHIFYNIGHQAYDYGLNDLWGEALAAQWDRVWPSKPLFGAFIWEWQDQGLADKFPDKSNVNANGLRSENSKGIVTGYRVPKPEYYHVKMVYSPVTTDQREAEIDGKNWCARFTNRYSFTDLSELNCNLKALDTFNGDRVLEEGGARPQCPPGGSASVILPVVPDADTLRISFTDRNGVEVYAVRLHVPGAAVPQPPHPVGWDIVVDHQTKTSGLNLLNRPDAVGVSAKGISLLLDKSTGQATLLSGKYVAQGPTLNLGELRLDDGDFLNKNDTPWIGSKKPPLLKNVHLTSGVGWNDVWTANVTADVALSEAPDKILGRLDYSMCFDLEGTVDWSYRIKWSATDMQAWELGLKFDIPGSQHFSWYRKGQWTEYPAGHVGANQGSVTHEDRSFESTKRDTVWASVLDDSGTGLVVAAASGPLHTRCRFDDNTTTLFTSSAVSVDRDFSSGFVDNTRITFKQGHTYEGSFRMWLTGK